MATDTWGGVVTTQIILVYGAFGTTLVAVGYQIPRAALRREAFALLEMIAPLAGTSPSTLRAELEEREKVERHLGLQTGLMTELQAGIVILSPVLAAATTLLIPTG